MVRKIVNYFQLLDSVFETSVLYIDSGLDEGAKERNFVAQGNFALFPSYHIPSRTEQSFMFKIIFHVSGRYPAIHNIYLFLYCRTYLIGRRKYVSRRSRCIIWLPSWQRSHVSTPWKW